jgi:hypothetical protein
MTNSLLPNSTYLPDNFSRSRNVLMDDLRDIKTALNKKTTGEYYKTELVTGQTIFGGSSNNRAIYRVLVDFGALPNTSAKSEAHGITFDENTTFLKIYGSATDTTSQTAIPLPYSDTTSINNNISIQVDSTNVTITTAADYSSYDTVYVVLEYVKL